MSTVRTYPPDLFEPRPPERERAVSVLDKMADERRAWLERMRDRLAVLCLLRVDMLGEAQACVTADDAEVLRKTQASLALPADCSPNIMGTVFRTRDWVRSEHPDHVSTTPGSNGNLIYRWRYVGRRAA